MAWQGILGHDAIAERFRRALSRGRLASSFLFVGPAGVGKRTFAFKLAQSLFCETRPEAALDPCGSCPACLQFSAGAHPDFTVVSKPEDKSGIPVALLIGDDEHRRRAGLLHEIALKPQRGGRKVAVIDDADHLNQEGANALLKTLEEPPSRAVLILVGTSPARQLPTIRSRCQVIAFRPLADVDVATILRAEGLAADATAAGHLAAHANGSVQQALELADPDLWTFRAALQAQLAHPLGGNARLADRIGEFVDAAGKEAPPRRTRLRLAIGFAAELFRARMRLRCGSDAAADPEVTALARGSLAASGITIEDDLRLLEHCTEAAAAIDRNANQATLIETWASHIAAR